MSLILHTGDCLQVMPSEGPFDLIFADPPYGDTALWWDKIVVGWEAVAAQRLKASGSLWMFGSMRHFMGFGMPKGFRYAQDIVWEKPNGTGFAADRFKRVHEHATQFYLKGAPWKGVYNDVQRVAYTGPDKHVRRRTTPRGDHYGQIDFKTYEDDGTRLVRSVVKAPSVRRGLHRTEKPVALLELLIRTSCPPGGLVGDFFAGSGAVGEACAATGRRYVGCEIDPEMAEKARARLQGGLFGAAA